MNIYEILFIGITGITLLLDLDGESLGDTAEQDVDDPRLVRIKLGQVLLLSSLQA